MEQFKALMGKKVAGVPVMALFALMMGVLLYYAIKMKPAADDSVEGGEPTDAAAVDEDLPDTSQPVFSATPAIYQPSGASVASSAQEDSNELWGKRALEWLIAQGVTYDLASGTVSKYLAGEGLSASEGAVRDRAIGQWGLPPEAVDYAPTGSAPSNVYKGPATAQGVPPLRHKVRGKSDDQPAELARVYYGIANGDAVNKIRAANTTVAWPAAPGTEIRIPEKFAPKYYRTTSATRSLYDVARKNGSTPAKISALNPSVTFPVKAGTRVRVR